MNARAMKHSGAAEILFEDTVVEGGEVIEKLEGYALADRILRLLQDTERLAEMTVKSKQFLRRNTNERILSELYQDDSYNNGIGGRAAPFRPLLSNQRLLQMLSAAYNRSPDTYDPVSVVGDEDDLIYYRHRAAGLLSLKPWQDINLGVKLIGLTQYSEKIPTLLHMLADRTPAAPIKRLFGGDFKHVGFVRRNILQALQVLNHLDDEVERHMVIAIEDPYFEVRSQVCRAAGYFGSKLASKEIWLKALLDRLNDRCFEVVVEAAKALGEIGSDDRALEVLLRMKESHYWQVRDASLRGLHRLIERRVIHPTPEFLSEISRFILTATDFRPYFSIKETYKTIQSSCRETIMAGNTGKDTVVFSDSASATRKQ